MLKKTIKLLLLCIIWIVAINSAFALNFQIDKGRKRIKMPGGWSDGGVIKVVNRDAELLKVRVYVSDWAYSNSDGSKNFLPVGTYPNSCADWLKYYPADFVVPGNGTQAVNYVVEIPKDAKGGYYAILFFEVEVGKSTDAKGSRVKVFNRLGSLFTVEVEGTVKREASVSDFSIKETRSGALWAEATFENIGNVDITAKGTLDIIDQEGFVLGRAKFNDVYTMPLDKARLKAEDIKATLSKGKLDIILTFDMNGDILVKEYQADVSAKGNIVELKEID